MTTLSDLRTRLKTDLKITGTDFDTALDDAVRSALRQLRGKRLWFLKTSSTLTLSNGDSTVALPTNFSAPNTFNLIYSGSRFRDGDGFDYYTYENFENEYLTVSTLPTGTPTACAVLGDTLYVTHIADADYSLPITYFKQDVTLPATDAATSVWFDEGYDAVRSLAAFMFKREVKGFMPSEEDGELAKYYMNNLYDQHNARSEGR